MSRIIELTSADGKKKYIVNIDKIYYYEEYEDKTREKHNVVNFDRGNWMFIDTPSAEKLLAALKGGEPTINEEKEITPEKSEKLKRRVYKTIPPYREEIVTPSFCIDCVLDDCVNCPDNKDGECMTEGNCFEVKRKIIDALRMLKEEE